jgi:hypothetical protein
MRIGGVLPLDSGRDGDLPRDERSNAIERLGGDPPSHPQSLHQLAVIYGPAAERRFRDATSAAVVVDLLQESIGVRAHRHARALPSMPDE